METILRDAHQSLIATRMSTEQMLPIIDKLDKVGYYAVECWGRCYFRCFLTFPERGSVERLRKLRDGFKKHKTSDAVPWTEHPWISSICR